MNLGDIFTPITYNNPAVNPIVVGYNMNQPTILPFINFGGNSSIPSIGNNGYSSPFGTNYGSGNIIFGGSTIGANPFGDNIPNFGGFQNNNFSYNRDSDIRFTGTTSSTKTTSTTKTNTSTNSIKHTKQGLRNSFAKNAQKYIGYKESDGSYKRFSNSPEWCADFVSYVIKEAYKQQGLNAPTWFGNHRVEILRKQAIEHGKYLCLTDKQDRTKIVKENVKVGNILILRENGASHTGIVSKIYPNGTFDTIEGNVTSNGDDRVLTMHYSPYHKDISGFVQLP